MRQIPYKSSYRTGRDDLLQEFYIPSLASAHRYDRAVGYFSSGILSRAAQGLSAFFGENKGRMRLVFGGELAEEDLNAALRGYELARISDLLETQFRETVDRVVGEIDRRRLELMSLLVATGRLEIRFAYRQQGIFHDKFGLFYGRDDAAVAFQGSANESEGGFIRNYERIFLHRSWEPSEEAVVTELEGEFEALWQNRAENCVVLPLPEACREDLITIYRRKGGVIVSPAEEAAIANFDHRFGQAGAGSDAVAGMKPTLPMTYKGHPYALRDHQQQALAKWKTQSYYGILQLCTGGGKTITAAHAITRLAERRLFAVISAPYINLAEQWCDELANFNIQPLRAWGSEDWRNSLEEQIRRFEIGAIDFCCVVVVNATLLGSDFRRLIDSLHGDELLYVADECHHLRSAALAGLLPKKPKLRLGLSATPMHYLDTVGNSGLEGYFGSVCFEYGLEAALHDGVLTPYAYMPLLVQLTEEEAEEYLRISAQISAYYAREATEDNPHLESLLRQRAMLVATAEGKLTAFDNVLRTRRPQAATLAYCGVDADVPDEPRQIDEIVGRLSQHGWRVARYTSKEARRQRSLNMEAFSHGGVDALVAMKCLDEGVDIPACRLAFILASSRDPREFIQRRGRVLRRAPGKSLAEIYDFLVLPPSSPETSEVERRLVKSELERAVEFARLATNRIDALKSLEPAAVRFGLAHFL